LSIAPDLESLIVVAKYLSPIKDITQLNVAIFSALRRDDPYWSFSHIHKRSMVFTYDFEGRFKLQKVKDKDILQKCLLAPKKSLPCNFHVLFSKTTERGSVIDVKCLPVLYRCITQLEGYLKVYPVSIADVKFCVFESTELIRRIFIGSLECEELDPPHPLKPIEERFHEGLALPELGELLDKAKATGLLVGENWVLALCSVNLIESLVNKKLEQLKESTDGSFDIRYKRLISAIKAKEKRDIQQLLPLALYNVIRNKLDHASHTSKVTSKEAKEISNIVISILKDLFPDGSN